MTAQNVFPKIDGDIQYASEVNRFAQSGKFIAAGSTPTLISGTAFQVLGSFVMSGLSAPVEIDIFCTTKQLATDFLTFQLSGLSANATLVAGSNMNTGSATYDFKAIIGSPFFGVMNTIVYALNDAASSDTAVNRIKYSNGIVNNLDTVSPFVLFLGGNFTGSTSVYNYMITTKGVGY